jgi:hypothetical protein
VIPGAALSVALIWITPALSAGQEIPASPAAGANAAAGASPDSGVNADGGAVPGEAVPVTGTLDILSTPPGVSVDIDGTAEGVTPLVGIVLNPGTHHLRLRGAGLKTQEQTIDISAGQSLHVSVTLPALPPESPSFLGTGVDVPVATAILAGTSAVLFGVGLGFGLAANNIQHQAGVNVSPSGVDLGITQAEAVQGKQYAQIANGFYIGAAAALVAAVVVAVVQPRHTEAVSQGSGDKEHASLQSGSTWSSW